tara:strand:- start:363 stop:812 length:450 start_codon:yes stop_codon:yes gene_type:complete
MGIVYKILCNETGECYIGSARNRTCYSQRRERHRNRPDCSSKQITDRGNYEFIIIEENKLIDIELRQREQYWIDISDHVINKYVACSGLTKEEYVIYHNGKYWKENKEKINNQRSIEVICECGETIQKRSLTRHRKTKKHQDYLKLNVD